MPIFTFTRVMFFKQKKCEYSHIKKKNYKLFTLPSFFYKNIVKKCHRDGDIIYIRSVSNNIGQTAEKIYKT